MQKMNKKLNENPVGANCVRPHFEGITKNNQNGITLIALIITIIVMLILVGVTINVALNGGLFQKAETATSGTEKQAIYEQIVSNMELTNDGKISVKGTFDKVVTEFGTDKVININPATVDDNTTEVTFSIVGKTGTYNYKISVRSVEKDSVQSPGDDPNPQLPAEIAGNVYEGEAGTTMYIAKNYEYIWFPEISTALMQYEYENGELIFLDPIDNITYRFTVSDNTISGNYEGTNYVLSLEPDKTYTPEYLPSEYKQVYIGIYYNEEKQKFATIRYTHNEPSKNAVDGWFQYENLSASWYQNALAMVTTYDDSKTIQKNNNLSDYYDGDYIKYTLLEAGQF